MICYLVGGADNKFADEAGDMTDDISKVKVFPNLDDATLFASDLEIPTVKGFRLDLMSVTDVAEATGTKPKPVGGLPEVKSPENHDPKFDVLEAE